MILFVEYRILEPHLEAFVRAAASRPEWWTGAELLENTEQPGIYVEIWRVNSLAEASETEKKRREGRLAAELAPWIQGGADGLRIWTFRPLTGSDRQVLPGTPPEPNGSV